jgi:hypothetical protein
MLAVRPNNDLADSDSLAHDIHHAVICLLRVYALSGRSRRILGLLLLFATGSIVTALVGRFPRLVYACPDILLLSIKVPLVLLQNTGGGTIAFELAFGGCAQYTPQIGYVADPACDPSSSMIRLITLVIGVDVSYRVQISVY